MHTLDPAAAYALWAASYPPQAHNPLMLAEERSMRALLPANLRGKQVLDAGCGSGRYMRLARERGARAVVGVDLSHQMLVRAKSAEERVLSAEERVLSAEERVLSAEERVLSAELPQKRTQHSALSTQHLLQATLDALPLRTAWAHLTLCGLTLGHLEDLGAALAELRRVTRPGGTLLCSDFHPLGHALGWRREFTHAGVRYAVRHTPHLYSHWQHACRALGLTIMQLLEPRLDPADIPVGASFDPAALELPVALVFELRRN